MRGDSNLDLPFLNGVYVAVDALRSGYLLVDGPYCVFTKAEMQYCHNLHCRLLPHVGHSRVVHTASESRKEEVASAALDRTRTVEQVFDQLCALPDAEVILATSFDFHQLLNFPLEAMAKSYAERSGKLVCHLRSQSLGGTWLDGYAGVCETLARKVPLEQGRSKPDMAAVVGYLFDRDEPDHHGNLQELRRMLSAAGLQTRSVWLSGCGIDELQAAQEASVVVSLPYARQAARILAERLKIKLIELELPVGLTASAQFIRTVAEQLCRGTQVQSFLDRELQSAVQDTQHHVLRVISGNTARILSNDPHLTTGLQALCRDVGLRPLQGSAPAEAAALRCHEVCFSPTLSPLRPKG